MTLPLRRTVLQARWLTVVVAAVLLVVPSLVFADTVVRGGIITNVVSNGTTVSSQ